MGLFRKRIEVFREGKISVGEFNPTMPGCYDSVKTFTLSVKPKRLLFVKVSSELPLSVVIADDANACVFHIEEYKEGTLGPICTGGNKTMGLILGVFPGDKTKVDVEIWMCRS